MEYCSNGDLHALISHYKNIHKYIPEQTIWSVLAQLLMALYRCHYAEDAPPLVTIYDRMKPPNSFQMKQNIVIHPDFNTGNICLTGNYNVEFGEYAVLVNLGFFV